MVDVPMDVPLVLDRPGAAALAEGRAVISIGNPGEPALTFPWAREVLRLEFVDKADPAIDGTPAAHHAEAIVAFARAVGPGPGLVVHCAGGESRSTAAALLSACAWGWEPDTALDRLRRSHPPGRFFSPNALLIRLGDDVLGLGGRLAGLVVDPQGRGRFWVTR